MLADAELYFIHGWGFDGRAWEGWLPSIKNNVLTYIFDRGYFKTNKQNFSFNISDRFKIVIVHSFGLHYLSSIDFTQIHTLVLINSFRYFHQHRQNRRLGQKQISIMKKKLIERPYSVLTDFYSNCGLTAVAKSPAIVHSQLLYDDLILLDNNQIDIHLLKPIRQILLLHGRQDSVVDIEHSKEFQKVLPNSKLFIHSEAGHGLPITDSIWCLNTIQTQLSKQIIIN